MMKSKRFEPIQEIASTSANDLSRSMGEAGRKVADLERQLEQLQSYRDEYLRNSSQSAAPIDAVKLQNYRSFLDRLGEALRQHLKSLETARAEYEKRRLGCEVDLDRGGNVWTSGSASRIPCIISGK